MTTFFAITTLVLSGIIVTLWFRISRLELELKQVVDIQTLHTKTLQITTSNMEEMTVQMKSSPRPPIRTGTVKSQSKGSSIPHRYQNK